MPNAVVNIPGSPVWQGTTPTYTCDLEDAAGASIPGALLNSLTLTLFDTLTGNIINGVDGTSILNTGRGTVDAKGHVTIVFEPGDMGLEFPTASAVQRSLVLNFTYNGGTFYGAHMATFTVLAVPS